MSWNSCLFGALLAAVAVLAVGCGGSEEQETNRWVNELLLANGEFQEAAVQGKKEIAEATTGSQLAAAYSAYAEEQRKQIRRVEGLEPPSECEDEQAAIEGFMRKVAAVTEALSHQESMTRARLRELEREIADATRGLISRFKSVAENEGC